MRSELALLGTSIPGTYASNICPAALVGSSHGPWLRRVAKDGEDWMGNPYCGKVPDVSTATAIVG